MNPVAIAVTPDVAVVAKVIPPTLFHTEAVVGIVVNDKTILWDKTEEPSWSVWFGGRTSIVSPWAPKWAFYNGSRARTFAGYNPVTDSLLCLAHCIALCTASPCFSVTFS